MLEKMYAFLTVLLMTTSQLGSTSDYLPTLDIPATIDIPSGSSLAITCVGKRELKWKLPELNIDDLEDRCNKTETRKVINGELKYESILTVTQMTWMDSGSYECHYNNSDDDDNRFASSYIFVNDPYVLILPHPVSRYFHFNSVHHGRETVLYCPSTYSDINITLCKTSGNKCEPVPQGYEVAYDATKGFIIPSGVSYFNGIFRCDAHYGNVTQEVSLNLVYFEETATPEPYISSNDLYYPMVNSNFSLNCSVSIKFRTLVHMIWDYPNKLENGSRHIIKEPKIELVTDARGYFCKNVTKELRITDAQLSDAGIYRCTVIDHTNKSSAVEIDIKIYEWSQKPYVNLTTEIDTTKPFEAQIGEKFQFFVSIDVFPHSTTISTVWTKDGKILRDNEHNKLDSSLNRASLVIGSLGRLDSGKYVLIVSSEKATNNISVTLHVIDKPYVIVTGNQSIYMLNERYILVCHGIGYPNPAAWWKWKKLRPSDNTSKSDSPVEAEKLEDQPNVINETKRMVDGNAYAYLEVSAVESGNYTCVSSNRMGDTKQTVPFFVTDAEDGFHITTTNRKPVEGDTVKIICKASHHYQGIKWMWKPFSNAWSNISAVSLPIEKTKYSLTTVKEFPDITLQDSGIYECLALRNSDSNPEKKSVNLKVRAIEKPTFNSTNMDGTKASIPREVKFEFNCYVEGLPFPEITWSKDKEVLDVSNKPGIELMDKSQKLLINRVIENDEGFYKCEARNRGGVISANLTLIVLTASPLKERKISTTETSIIVVIVVIAILLLSLSVILGKRVCKERKEKQEIEFFSQALFKQGQVEMFNPDLPLADQVELLPYDHRWEFPKERLKLGRTLGQGAFGRVVKAEAIGIEDGEMSTTVAVKMLKERVDTHQRKALMAELKILIHLGRHLNIVNLLGGVTKNMAKGELMVIVEYCPYGNLRHYLLRKRSTFINQLDPTNGKVDPGICTLPGSPGIENIEKVAAAYDSAFASGIINPNYRNQSIHYADLLHGKRSTSSSDGSASRMTEKTTTTQLSGDREYFNSDEQVRNGSYCKDSGTPTVKDQPVTTCDLVCFAFQCARGMEYLTSRKLIHRDLAARNVLLAEDNVVKICDFGLAKDCYKYSKYVKKGDGPLPLKWMAIESIRDKVFTSKSDVWSFGILLWEFFTLGGNPYPGIDIDEGFYRRLKDGYRMEKPEYAPNSIYEIMESCWKFEPSDRPDFTGIAENLGELLQESVRKYYVQLNEPYLMMNVELLNNNDYLQMGSTGKSDYVNIDVESSNPYDSVGAVRPVDNGPVPKAPMEVVPMIQLEPVKKIKEKGNKRTVPAPIPDLLTVSPSFNKSRDPDYLQMLSPKDFCSEVKPNDHHKELGPVTLNVTSLVTS